MKAEVDAEIDPGANITIKNTINFLTVTDSYFYDSGKSDDKWYYIWCFKLHVGDYNGETVDVPFTVKRGYLLDDGENVIALLTIRP